MVLLSSNLLYGRLFAGRGRREPAPQLSTSDHSAIGIVLETGRRPAIETHAEHEAVALQHFLDLGERLLAEVRRTKQLDFRALHEIADVVDVLRLEAVRRTHGELELVDRPQQQRVELHLGDLGAGFFFALQVHEHRQLILEDAAGATDGFFRVDGAVGLDVDHELVEVGALFDASRVDHVRHATHGREGCIQLQTADRAALLFERSAIQRRAVATTAFNTQRHGELAGLREVREHQLRVHDFDVVVRVNVAGRHRSRALLRQTQLRAVARVHLEGNLLEVQQDVDDVFLHAFDGGVLMEHAFDFHFRDRSARHGRQQYATQRVAERVAEAALERFDDNARLARGRRLHLDYTRLQKFAD